MSDSTEVKKEISDSVQRPTYKIMIDSIPLKNKPENGGIVVDRMKKNAIIKDVTIPQLFKYLSLGYTVRPGILKGGASEDNFIQQEFIFIDVDNDVKKEKLLH